MRGIAQEFSRWLRAAAMLMILALSACSYAQVGPDFPQEAKLLEAQTFECCFEPEKYYPGPLVRIALSVANELGPPVSGLLYGDYESTEYPGLLTGKQDAHAAILAPLRPLDILLVSNNSYRIGRLMPGQFSHALVYLGTEAELRAAGLWSMLAPYHDRIRAGQTLIEATWPDVHLIAPRKAFETDQVLALRPELTPSQKRQAVERLLAVMGKPYNYTLGIDPANERFACTGLVYHAMPGLGFRLREVYGQTVVIPDDVAAQAVRGEKLQPIIYVAGTEDGYTTRSLFALMVEIASYWGVPGARD